MRFRTSVPYRLLTILLFVLILLATTILTIGQEEQPAPQFLYRNGNRLVLLNGYTGEATELPIDVADQDRFTWLPDGKYLLAQLQDGEALTYCLNLYDVDSQEWVYDEPIACAVGNVTFSADGKQIVYATSEENNGILWLFSLEDETSQELYRTTEGDELRPSGISRLEWSPTETYLTFVPYRWILGGTLNAFVIMNLESQDYATVSAPNVYYASYSPIWSEDDRWFLLTLQEEYVTSSTLVSTNHRGDVYLVNSDTGEKFRLTYTPAAYELDVRWTDDGRIAFTEVIEQEITLTIEEAMNVQVVPPEAIVTPEPVEWEDFYDRLAGVMVSPDSNLGAWVSSSFTEEEERSHELNFGSIVGSRSVEFSVPIPESYQYGNILIGWRPSDYPYLQG